MQRIVCPDTKPWTMIERLISVDVERLGNVQWWSWVSQYTSNQMVRAMQCGEEIRGCCAVSVGHNEGSGAAIFLTPDGVKRGTKMAIMMEHERWDRVFSATCVGVPWQLRPDQRNLVRPVVPEAEAEQGVAPVIVIPAVPKVDRRRYVTKRDLVKYGYTDECQACTQLASDMHNANVPHDDRCRDRIGELMTSDDDQRQVERVTSRAAVEVENEIQCPEAGEEVDVGEPTVVEDQRSDSQSAPQSVSQPVPQPVPTVRVGGSSSSGTRSGVGSRASETNTDDRETKRVRFTESRGQKRQGEDVEETWRVEGVVGDAADAAPEQMNILLDAREQSMNSFVQSKMEVFEKIEESLRPLCMVEDLNDDEVMELCKLSNELNACEATAILNPSKFASCATRLRLREGFAVDLTTAKANGTMWDLSLEDDRAELRRVQKREQPELLVGSPSSDEFSSLLSTRAAREISKLKTEKIEPQIRACVESYKLQIEMQKHFVHEHPKDSNSWEIPEVQSLINDPRVYSIDGPMCRWSLRTRGSKDKTEFMRMRTRWITSSKEIAEVLRGGGRWKRDKRFVHMTGKPETVSEYPASLVVAMLSAIKRQMISDGAIKIGEMHFAGPVPHKGGNSTEFERNW